MSRRSRYRAYRLPAALGPEGVFPLTMIHAIKQLFLAQGKSTPTMDESNGTQGVQDDDRTFGEFLLRRFGRTAASKAAPVPSDDHHYSDMSTST